MAISDTARRAIKKKRLATQGKTLGITLAHQDAWLDAQGWHSQDAQLAALLSEDLERYTPLSQSADPIWDYAQGVAGRLGATQVYLRPRLAPAVNPDFIY